MKNDNLFRREDNRPKEKINIVSMSYLCVAFSIVLSALTTYFIDSAGMTVAIMSSSACHWMFMIGSIISMLMVQMACATSVSLGFAFTAYVMFSLIFGVEVGLTSILYARYFGMDTIIAAAVSTVVAFVGASWFGISSKIDEESFSSAVSKIFILSMATSLIMIVMSLCGVMSMSLYNLIMPYIMISMVMAMVARDAKALNNFVNSRVSEGFSNTTLAKIVLVVSLRVFLNIGTLFIEFIRLFGRNNSRR